MKLYSVNLLNFFLLVSFIGIILILYSRWSLQPIERGRIHKVLKYTDHPLEGFQEVYTLEEKEVLANLIQEGDFIMLGKDPEIQITGNYELNIWYDTLVDISEPLHFVFKVERPVLISEVFGKLEPSQLSKIDKGLSKYFEKIWDQIKIIITIGDLDDEESKENVSIEFNEGSAKALKIEPNRSGILQVTIESLIVAPDVKYPFIINKSHMRNDVVANVIQRKTMLGITIESENYLAIALAIIFSVCVIIVLVRLILDKI